MHIIQAEPKHLLLSICTKTMDIHTEKLLVNIKAISAEVNETYGKRRIEKALNKMGFSIGCYRAASLMKLAKIKAKHPRKSTGMVSQATSTQLLLIS